MTQETVPKPALVELSQEPKLSEKKKQISIQELIESLKSTGEDIGQISELSS
jgi:hypothetical protein